MIGNLIVLGAFNTDISDFNMESFCTINVLLSNLNVIEILIIQLAYIEKLP